VTPCFICGATTDLVPSALGPDWCADAWPCLHRADGLAPVEDPKLALWKERP